MTLFKKLFKKVEQRPDITEKLQKQREVKKQLDSVFKDKRNKVCKLCEDPILETERYAKQGGYFWHPACWNKAKAIAKSGGHIS